MREVSEITWMLKVKQVQYRIAMYMSTRLVATQVQTLLLKVKYFEFFFNLLNGKVSRLP